MNALNNRIKNTVTGTPFIKAANPFDLAVIIKTFENSYYKVEIERYNSDPVTGLLTTVPTSYRAYNGKKTYRIYA
jgi:hypothetical protein